MIKCCFILILFVSGFSQNKNRIDAFQVHSIQRPTCIHGRIRTSSNSISRSTRRQMSSIVTNDNQFEGQDQQQQQQQSFDTQYHNGVAKHNEKFDLNLVLIDHYDSYTYNLYNMLSVLCTKPPLVLAKDTLPHDWNTKDELIKYTNGQAIDGVISSPGPGRPPQDVSQAVLQMMNNMKQKNNNNNNNNNGSHTNNEKNEIPILGVCLGHQALGYANGYPIELAPCGPVHGQVSTVHNVQDGLVNGKQKGMKYPSLFQNIPSEFQVVRYHSLVVNMNKQGQDQHHHHDSEQNSNHHDEDGVLQPTAYCYDNDENDKSVPIVMAVQHSKRPHYGVQFHPESISTQYGMQMMKNFCSICQEYKEQHEQKDKDQNAHFSNKENIINGDEKVKNGFTENEKKNGQQNKDKAPLYQVYIHKIEKNDNHVHVAKPEQVYESLYGSSTHSFWLDSANADVIQDNPQSRFSIMGGGVAVGDDNDGKQDEHDDDDDYQRPLFRRLEYYGQEHSSTRQGLYVYSSQNQLIESYPREEMNILKYLQTQFQSSPLMGSSSSSSSSSSISDAYNGATFVVKKKNTNTLQIEQEDGTVEESLPFQYRGGYVGYLGYEVRYDSQRFLEEMEHGYGTSNAATYNSNSSSSTQTQMGDPNVPTAAFIFADQSLVYDHWTQDWYLLSVVSSSSSDPSSNDHDGSKRALDWMQCVEQHIQSLSTPSTTNTITFTKSKDKMIHDQPKENGSTQKENDSTQKVNGIAQKENGSTQKVNGIAQKENGISQKENGISQKMNGIAPKENGIAQKVNGIAQKVNGIAQKENGSTQKVNGIAQKENGISQKENGIAQKENGIAQKVNGVAQRVLQKISTNGQATSTKVNGTSEQKKNNNNIKNNSIKKQDNKVDFVLNRSREQYENDVTTCHEYIRQGESYELCLTNQLEATVLRKPPTKAIPQQGQGSAKDPFGLYKILRKHNPAPFAAFVNFNANNKKDHKDPPSQSASIAICCSSPERFISVKPLKDNDEEDNATNGNRNNNKISYQVEAKPIKGTVARYKKNYDWENCATPEEITQDLRIALDLQQDVKNRAENLMIVDLLRNDVHRVCQPGTVHVPKLMDIESYATVHQMVSTIRGTLQQEQASTPSTVSSKTSATNGSTGDKNAMDALIACFPGGSMTGAPKLRTTELLHDLEQGANRGPYSGCLGYISLDGSMDMNIIIRTAVMTPGDSDSSNTEKDDDSWKISIGAGGAITYLSDSEDEYEEMLLKARAIRESVQTWYNNDDNDSDDGSDEVVNQETDNSLDATPPFSKVVGSASSPPNQ